MRKLAVLAAVCLPASVARADGFFVPPSRVDVAPVTMNTGAQPITGFHLTAGLHWASVTPNPKTWLDVGLGYIHERLPLDQCRRPPLPCGMAATTAPERDPLMVHGAYLELSKRMSGTRHRRTWLGTRAELLFADVAGKTRAGAGITGRAAWELFSTVKGGGRGGVILGAFSLGAFIEVGYRRLPGGARGVATSVGLSSRLPLIAVGG